MSCRLLSVRRPTRWSYWIKPFIIIIDNKFARAPAWGSRWLIKKKIMWAHSLNETSFVIVLCFVDGLLFSLAFSSKKLFSITSWKQFYFLLHNNPALFHIKFNELRLDSMLLNAKKVKCRYPKLLWTWLKLLFFISFLYSLPIHFRTDRLSDVSCSKAKARARTTLWKWVYNELLSLFLRDRLEWSCNS